MRNPLPALSGKIVAAVPSSRLRHAILKRGAKVPREARNSHIPIPPDHIRYRIVNHVPTVSEFLEIGWWCHQSIVTILARSGYSMTDFHDVLDWGAGCGRVIRFFEPLFGQVNFYGSDIDKPMIDWSKQHITGVTFKVNGAHTLPWPDNSFDFIYGISVFTHLTEEMQAEWLKELSRVLRPGGILLLTSHGWHVLGLTRQYLKDDDVATFEKDGYVYVANILDKVLPDWYQTSYQTEEHIRKTFSEHFEVLSFTPQGMSNYQDATLLRNKKAGKVAPDRHAVKKKRK